jgi:hypothetical protein
MGLRNWALHASSLFPLLATQPRLESWKKLGMYARGVLRRSAIKEGIVLDQLLYAITDMDMLP